MPSAASIILLPIAGMAINGDQERHQPDEGPEEREDGFIRKRRLYQRVLRSAKSGRDKDVQVTREVMNRLEQDGETPPDDAAVETFACFQCEAAVPKNADHCPRCGTTYVQGIFPDKEDMSGDGPPLGDSMLIAERGNMTCVHFDVQEGVVSFAELEKRAERVTCECEGCGTLIQFDACKCPICGRPTKRLARSVVELIANVEIGKELDELLNSELFCPICAKVMQLKDGKCEGCATQLIVLDGEDCRRLQLILPAESLIFLHIDVETGELSYLVRNEQQQRYPQLGFKLEGIGRGTLDVNWESIKRI